MRAIYINDGSIPVRPDQTHFAFPKAFNKKGIIKEINEALGIFEFEPDEMISKPNLILCNREELQVIQEEYEIKL